MNVGSYEFLDCLYSVQFFLLLIRVNFYLFFINLICFLIVHACYVPGFVSVPIFVLVSVFVCVLVCLYLYLFLCLCLCLYLCLFAFICAFVCACILAQPQTLTDKAEKQAYLKFSLFIARAILPMFSDDLLLLLTNLNRIVQSQVHQISNSICLRKRNSIKTLNFAAVMFTQRSSDSRMEWARSRPATRDITTTLPLLPRISEGMRSRRTTRPERNDPS